MPFSVEIAGAAVRKETFELFTELLQKESPVSAL